MASQDDMVNAFKIALTQVKEENHAMAGEIARSVQAGQSDFLAQIIHHFAETMKIRLTEETVGLLANTLVKTINELLSGLVGLVSDQAARVASTIVAWFAENFTW